MGIIKELFKPVVNQIKGKVGEIEVTSKLNPLIFGRVEHKLINNLIIVDEYGKSHQIDHVEIRKNGIFCIETKNYAGEIYGSENSDTITQYLGSKVHTHTNPLKQNKSHVYHVSKILGNKYPVQSVVVFTQNNADKISASNVINLNDLPTYLKNFKGSKTLSSEEINEVYELLVNAKSKMSSFQHLQNVKQTQKQFEKGFCPRCNGKLKIVNGRYGDFLGCENYPTCKFKKNL